jgi:hypothetical protein
MRANSQNSGIVIYAGMGGTLIPQYFDTKILYPECSKMLDGVSHSINSPGAEGMLDLRTCWELYRLVRSRGWSARADCTVTVAFIYGDREPVLHF